jgi:hypothetical protein
MIEGRTRETTHVQTSAYQAPRQRRPPGGRLASAAVAPAGDGGACTSASTSASDRGAATATTEAVEGNSCGVFRGSRTRLSSQALTCGVYTGLYRDAGRAAPRSVILSAQAFYAGSLCLLAGARADVHSGAVVAVEAGYALVRCSACRPAPTLFRPSEPTADRNARTC